MTWLQQLAALIPEFYVLSMAIVVLMAGLFLQKKDQNFVWILSVLAMLGGMYLVWETFGFDPKAVFGGHFIVDAFGQTVKCILLGVSILSFWHGNTYLFPKRLYSGEYYSLMLFSSLGMMVLVSSGSMLTMYLGLELLSLPLYTLVAIDKEGKSSAEAGIKYFVLGSLASAILLYGISLLFGATGTLLLEPLASALQLEAPSSQALFGLVFVVAGLAFKFGAAPFHQWIPDVYQGAPVPVVTFLSSAPKIAAFGMAYRLLVEGLPSLSAYWEPLLLALGLASLVLGNLVALVQKDLRRMLAYSAIAQVGYVFLAMGAGSESYMAALYYVTIYALSSVAAFALIAGLSSGQEELYRIDSLRALGRQRPMIGLALLWLMFSLAGVPPLLGFYAKLAVLRALVEAHYVWVAALAMLCSIVGAFYYLRVVRVMYFEKAEEPGFLLPMTFGAGRWLATANAWALLFLGIFPNLLFGLCARAFI